MKMERKSYGGFLPIELDVGKEFYCYSERELQRYNSGKTAIFRSLQQYNENYKEGKVYLPYYLCPSVNKVIEQNAKNFSYYNINIQLLPQNIELSSGDCIVLVNYFGVMDEKIDLYIKGIPENITIIIDNCHSFYHEPVFRKNLYNVYSCKKFFGVPDGAYLIGQNLDESPFDKSYASDKAEYLLECLEHGTDYCYNKKKKVDVQIEKEHTSMSELTKRLMLSVNYSGIRDIRSRNFEIYDNFFRNRNLIHCQQNVSPYVYPLNLGVNIKSELIERNIYIPTLWSHMIETGVKNSIEYLLAENTLFLPVDQRYNEADILFICEQVEELLKIHSEP